LIDAIAKILHSVITLSTTAGCYEHTCTRSPYRRV